MTEELTARELVDQLTELLTLRAEGENCLVANPTPAGAATGNGRIFGGQVIAQALAAAEATVAPDRPAHSLHAYFLRMGSDDHPIRYDITRDFDGGSFANRRVTAMQEGRLLLSLSASFHRREDGFRHQNAMPDVPGPEVLTSDVDLRRMSLDRFPVAARAGLARMRPIELRAVEQVPWFDPQPVPPVMHTWLRAVAPVGDDPRLHRAMLAFASDLVLMRTAILPHALSWFSGQMIDASLDHAMWFHDDFRIDEWLLFQTESPRAGRGRGLITGRFFRRDGTLVASVSQEGMFRLLNPPTPQ